MGCDIHGYVETRQHDKWWAFTGTLSLPRDYLMFTLLAGVRSTGEESPLIPPRGFPGDASYETKDEFGLHITEHECQWGDCHITTQQQADKWVSGGYSFPIGDTQISSPDHHTPSWLTAHELAHIIAVREITKGGSLYPLGAEYRGLLTLMASFEELGRSPRFVFWFDN